MKERIRELAIDMMSEVAQKCYDCSKWTIYGKICKGACDK